VTLATAHLDDIAVVPGDPGEGDWRPVRNHLGIDAFGVNAFVASAAGDRIIEEHDEAAPGAPHRELYFVAVAADRVTFRVDGETVGASAGTFVYIADPGARRSAIAGASGDTVLAIGAPAGAPFEVSAWERRELKL
jgi:hypothetical protein